MSPKHLGVRSTRLKIAVAYLAVSQLAVAAIGYPIVRAGVEEHAKTGFDVVFIVVFGCFALLLRAVWMHRPWARYGLGLLLLVHSLQGIGETVQLDPWGLLALTQAAADKVAFDELQSAVGLKAPWFAFWLRH